MEKKKLNDDGFSLVEMIIVVVLTAVVGGFMFMGIRVLNSRPVDECARKLQMCLQNNRNTTMGKLEANIKIYTDDGYITVLESIDGNDKKTIAGEKSVKVYAKVTGEANPVLLDTTGFTMSFDRSSGALKQIVGGTYDGEYVEKFIVERGSKKMEVVIEQITGKVAIK